MCIRDRCAVRSGIDAVERQVPGALAQSRETPWHRGQSGCQAMASTGRPPRSTRRSGAGYSWPRLPASCPSCHAPPCSEPRAPLVSGRRRTIEKHIRARSRAPRAPDRPSRSLRRPNRAMQARRGYPNRCDRLRELKTQLEAIRGSTDVRKLVVPSRSEHTCHRAHWHRGPTTLRSARRGAEGRPPQN